jgi:hypothetical protein
VDGADVPVAGRRQDLDAEPGLRPSQLLRRHLQHRHLLRQRRRLRVGRRPHPVRRLRPGHRSRRGRAGGVDRRPRLVDGLLPARRRTSSSPVRHPAPASPARRFRAAGGQPAALRWPRRTPVGSGSCPANRA